MSSMGQLSELQRILECSEDRSCTGLLQEHGLLYQYRSFDSFWNIVKSDSFWATNARFSNDRAEQELGVGVARCSSSDEDLVNRCCSENHFIVCFCEDGDRLSQWRGYAPYGGVSIGFDFHGDSCISLPFTIAESPASLLASGTPNPKQYLTCYLRAKKVLYLEGDATAETLQHTLRNTAAVSSDELGDLWRSFPKLMPYIKHNFFKEEAEYRIVANLDMVLQKERACFDRFVNFRRDGAKNIPYIVLRPGDYRYETRRCVVRTNFDDADLVESLRLSLAKELGFSNVFDCVAPGPVRDETHCFGCVRRKLSTPPNYYRKCRHLDGKARGIGLRQDDPVSLIVSQGKNQQAVFEIAYEWTQRNADKFKDKYPRVWCEGHLPIRHIIIGPCEKMEEIEESIKNYCRYSPQYWLRCVDVTHSSGPYRTPNFGT